MVKAQCETCSTKYSTPFAWYKKRKHHFCSKRCMGVWRSKTIRGKNHPQYKRSAHYRLCKRCKRVFTPHNKRSTFCSYKCHGEYSRNKREHGRSKETGHSYGYIHQWLKNEYGKAFECENYYCERRSNHFEWACINELGYAKKRENFWQLCKKCHLVYDKPPLIVSKKPIL